jgi:hypothetical protein
MNEFAYICWVRSDADSLASQGREMERIWLYLECSRIDHY